MLKMWFRVDSFVIVASLMFRQLPLPQNAYRLCQMLFPRKASTFAPTSLILRPYQEHCLDACVEALFSGVSRIGVSLPTGAGKTTVFISLLSRIPSPLSNPAASRSLIIVNSIELARQSANQVSNLFPKWSVEIEQGTKHKASGSADV